MTSARLPSRMFEGKKQSINSVPVSLSLQRKCVLVAVTLRTFVVGRYCDFFVVHLTNSHRFCGLRFCFNDDLQ